jgi:hypothetical protein
MRFGDATGPLSQWTVSCLARDYFAVTGVISYYTVGLFCDDSNSAVENES